MGLAVRKPQKRDTIATERIYPWVRRVGSNFSATRKGWSEGSESGDESELFAEENEGVGGPRKSEDVGERGCTRTRPNKGGPS